tara:strand:- start:570 stop:818 length:249 start_codon:yes stop_codon:yes gene_type:complete
MQSEILYNRLMNQDFILDYNEELTSDNVEVVLFDDGVIELQCKQDKTFIYTLSEESISNYQPISEKEIAIDYENEKLFIQFV